MDSGSDDLPSISLNISFDKINPEIYQLGMLIGVLVVFTIIFLLLHIIDFIIKRSIDCYRYFKDDYNRYF